MRILLAVTIIVVFVYRIQGFWLHQNQGVTRYSWIRTLPGGTSVRESAVSFDSGPRIYYSSQDWRLANEGLQRSDSVGDFSADTLVAIMRVQGECYLIPGPPGVTYPLAVSELQARNGDRVTSALTETHLLNATTGTGSLLSYTERANLFRTNPELRKQCGSLNIYNPVIADALTFPTGNGNAGQRVISAVTFSSVIRILRSGQPTHTPKRRFFFKG